MSMPMRLVVLAPVLFAGACATMMSIDEQKAALSELLTAFHDQVRWQRCQTAADLVAKERREEFFDHCEELTARLGLQETRVGTIELDLGAQPEKKQASAAKAEVRLSYYLLPDSVVRTQRAQLSLSKTAAGAWQLDMARGAFYPALLPERAEATPPPAPGSTTP